MPGVGDRPLGDDRGHHDDQDAAGHDVQPSVGAGPPGTVLSGGQHEEGSDLDGDDPGRQHHVGWAEDLHVQAVGVVPPVIEGRRRDHGEGAPDGDPGAP